jgi:hypothetical protein
MRATRAGTMIAADAPASAWPAMAQPTVGERIIISDEQANTTMTQRKMRTHPTRWPSFAPVITRAATTRP